MAATPGPKGEEGDAEAVFVMLAVGEAVGVTPVACPPNTSIVRREGAAPTVEDAEGAALVSVELASVDAAVAVLDAVAESDAEKLAVGVTDDVGV